MFNCVNGSDAVELKYGLGRVSLHPCAQKAESKPKANAAHMKAEAALEVVTVIAGRAVDRALGFHTFRGYAGRRLLVLQGAARCQRVGPA